MARTITIKDIVRARRATQKKENAPYVPSTMVVNLKQTTKKRYDEMRRSNDATVTTRPFGFLYEKDDERRVFITEDNVCYEGINTLSSLHTTEMFSTWETEGIEVYTMITLMPKKEDAAA